MLEEMVLPASTALPAVLLGNTTRVRPSEHQGLVTISSVVLEVIRMIVNPARIFR